MEAQPQPRARSWWRRPLRWCGWGIVLLLLAVLGRGYYALRDRSPGYTLDWHRTSEAARAEPRPFQAGFAQEKINPDLSDPGRPVWIAGFDHHRAATGIHDDLWAVACVFDDGHTRIGIASLDAIGLFHDDVIEIRRAVPAEARLDYVIVCATHNHSTPDLMGLWGPHPLRSGVDPRYRRHVLDQTVRALSQAAAAVVPARVIFHEIPMPTAGLVADTRRPEVFDPDVRVMHFRAATNATTLGTLIGWANHPETVWSRNTELTADFPGYLRGALAEGVRVGGRWADEGVGGIHVYVNGAVGGLMSTTPSVTVRDPYLAQEFKEPTHDKARAVAHQLVSRILPRLRDPSVPAEAAPVLTVRARTIELPVANPLFLLAPVLGVLDRGHVRWKTIRSEVALVTLGQASLACLPGEIYPELVNGGIERAPGGDYAVDPVEVPPLRELMPGRIKFVFGLANDEIGYVIPRSQWDQRPPYLYGAERPVYGEINSLGPETAERIHAVFREWRR